MDPNETLKNIRRDVKILITGEDTRGYELTKSELEAISVSLAEAVDALDGWLSKGGFAPDDWKDRGMSGNWRPKS